MKKVISVITILLLYTNVFSQTNSITDKIIETLLAHFYEHTDATYSQKNDEPIYVMLDIFGVYAFFPPEISTGNRKIVFLLKEEDMVRVINNSIHYYHVSLNIEDNSLIMYVQQGLGIRYNGHSFRYELIKLMNDSDALMDTISSRCVWTTIMSMYLSQTTNTHALSDTVPIVFGRYKYGYDIEKMHLSQQIGNYTIVPVSEFVNRDGYYIDFYKDYRNRHFLLLDVTYNAQGNIIAIVRKINISDTSYTTHVNGVYRSDHSDFFEICPTFMTNIRHLNLSKDRLQLNRLMQFAAP